MARVEPRLHARGAGEYLRRRCSVAHHFGDVDVGHCEAAADHVITPEMAKWAHAAFAGELASTLGVLPIETQRVRKGVIECARHWMSERGSLSKTSAKREGVIKLRNYLQSHALSFHETKDRAAMAPGA